MNHSRKTLTFVRHGESVANAGGMTMPHHAIPLSATGRRQATELATLIEVQPSVVLVSNMIRTHETAAPFCERHAIVPKINPTLDEFSVIDPALIEGMDGVQRKPFVKSYWDDPQPHKRLGDKADTFAEFEHRVSKFMSSMEALPDLSVIFGHGIWFALLVWRLRGFTAHDSEDMRAFRHFQGGFPMPNCAVYTLSQGKDTQWSVQANVDLMARMKKSG